MAHTNNLTPDLRTYLDGISVKYEDNSPPQTASSLIKTEEVYCKEEHIEKPQDNQPKTVVWNLMQFQLGFSPYGLPLTSLLHNNIQVKPLSDPPLEVKQEDEGPASKATSVDNTSETGALSSNSKKIKKEDSKDSPSEEKKVKTKAPRKKKVFWTQEEDARALELLTELGPKWTKIGRMIGDRSGKQVRDRYLQNLKPNINFEKWTKEEDALIVELYNKLGSKWLLIAEHLPNRTDNQVKNRFHGKLLHQMPQLSQDAIEPIVKSETDVKVEHSS